MKLCESHQTFRQESSNSYANVIKQFCNSRLKVMRKFATNYAKVIKRRCKRRPTVMQKSSNSYAKVVQYLSTSRPTVMQQLCNSRPTVVQKSSNTVWGYPSSARHRRHTCTRVVGRLLVSGRVNANGQGGPLVPATGPIGRSARGGSHGGPHKEL